MSNLSLLFASPLRNLLDAFGAAKEAKRETGPAPAWTEVIGEDRNDCTLPSGVASLEHWLDLNA